MLWPSGPAFPSPLARAGTHAALRNIANGKTAPNSGHDNTHYFDSISLIHALAIASVKELDSAEIQRLLLEDITWTHSEDGIWCAQALAEATMQLRNGYSTQEAIQTGLRFLPENSWSQREVLRAMNLTSHVSNHLDRVSILEENFVDRIYAFPYSAPETLALLFAHAQDFHDPELFFASSFLHKRHTDALPPLMGFMAGLIAGSDWIPLNFREGPIFLDGVCIPSCKGAVLTT
jgi:ADP-ribosylglycohydrolase